MTESKALAVKEGTIDLLGKRIRALEQSGEMHFPPDYSPQNALKSAWLILQGIQDKDKKPALEVCTKPSIYNALFDMVIQGLNPAKKQGYFIVYGRQLVFQRSYFGSEALAKRVDPDIADIVAEPVYEGDEFEYEIIRGRKQIVKHKQSIESVNAKKVKAAYCMIIGQDGEIKKTDIMTFEEIKKAWAMSKVNPIGNDGKVKPGSTHDEFMSEMVRKTVINRACKAIFNSSDDKYLRIAAQRSEVIRSENEVQEEIDENANQNFIDVDAEPESEAMQSDRKEEPRSKVNGGNGREYLTCPASIDKKQPRKSVEVCGTCKNRNQCDPYVEWAFPKDQEQPNDTAEGPLF